MFVNDYDENSKLKLPSPGILKYITKLPSAAEFSMDGENLWNQSGNRQQKSRYFLTKCQGKRQMQ